MPENEAKRFNGKGTKNKTKTVVEQQQQHDYPYDSSSSLESSSTCSRRRSIKNESVVVYGNDDKDDTYVGLYIEVDGTITAESSVTFFAPRKNESSLPRRPSLPGQPSLPPRPSLTQLSTTTMSAIGKNNTTNATSTTATTATIATIATINTTTNFCNQPGYILLCVIILLVPAISLTVIFFVL